MGLWPRVIRENPLERKFFLFVGFTLERVYISTLNANTYNRITVNLDW